MQNNNKQPESHLAAGTIEMGSVRGMALGDWEGGRCHRGEPHCKPGATVHSKEDAYLTALHGLARRHAYACQFREGVLQNSVHFLRG